VKRWLLLYEVVGDFVARRAEFREEHLRLLREAAGRGEVDLAGAAGSGFDTQQPEIAHPMVFFRAVDRTVATRFAENDPYVKNGIVTRWRVLEWIEVVSAGG
jgi:uncharacterized protein YciI